MAYDPHNFGFHPDLPEDVYYGHPAWQRVASYSRLKQLDKSPAHLKHAIDNPIQDPTAAMLEGRRIDCALLEPEKFDDQWHRATHCSTKLSSGKREGKPCGVSACWHRGDEWWCGKHKPKDAVESKAIITDSEYKKISDMVTAVHAHPMAEELLFKAKGQSQVVGTWRDQISGQACRMRLDRLVQWHGTTIVDLKKTVDASPKGFPWQIKKYGYHVQAAMYCDGMITIAELLKQRAQVDHYFIVAVEPEPPYAVAVYELEPSALEEGRWHYRHHMETWRDCIENKKWPGYTDGKYEVIDIPGSAYRFSA